MPERKHSRRTPVGPALHVPAAAQHCGYCGHFEETACWLCGLCVPCSGEAYCALHTGLVRAWGERLLPEWTQSGHCSCCRCARSLLAVRRERCSTHCRHCSARTDYAGRSLSTSYSRGNSRCTAMSGNARRVCKCGPMPPLPSPALPPKAGNERWLLTAVCAHRSPAAHASTCSRYIAETVDALAIPARPFA